MNRKLKNIAAKLSEADIQELIRIKKLGDKRAVTLRKKRDKLAADLAKIDAELAKITGEPAAAPAKPGRRGRKPAAAAPAKAAKGGKKKSRRRTNLTGAVRDILTKAGEPLRASQVVDALPEAGIKVADVSDMRKRISVVLASQKKTFEQVSRGMYQLKG